MKVGTCFMANEKDIYFITMENLSEYMDNDNKKLTDMELENRVKLNFSLFKENNNLEKKKMLLNNCLLTFRLFEGNISADLLFPVYYELIKIQPLTELKEAQALIEILYEKYLLFTSEAKNKYCSQLMEILYILAKMAYNSEEYEFLAETINKIEKIYNENDKSDDSNLFFAKTLALYGNLFFAIKEYNKAYSLFYNAYEIVELVTNGNKEKIENLAYLSFSLGNILFQADYCAEAQDYFQQAIKFCLDYDFQAKFEIMHLAYNYLSQVEVCLKEYDKAIDIIKTYLDVTKDMFSGDDYTYICAEFYFRIGLIYNKFKTDKELCIKNMALAKEFIDQIHDKNEKAIALLTRINDFSQ